jgi:multidrug resistance efflux pump
MKGPTMDLDHPKLRSDLIIVAIDLPDDEQEFKIKDPIRSQYMTANVIQYFFFSKFDGIRSIAEICAELEEFFETECPVEVGRKYVAEARKRHLLDITFAEGTPRDYANACRRVIRLMRGDGLWRHCQAVVERRDAKRAVREEDQLLANAVVHLGKRRFHEAVEAVDGVLDLRPDHELARRLREHMHQAFFSVLGKELNWAQINVPLFNPDRVLAPATRVLGWLFDPRPMAVFSALLAFLDVTLLLLFPETREPVNGMFIIKLVFIYGLLSLIHEAGHAIACKRAGGSVRSIGAMFWYLVLPVPYTDISDVHLIRDRKKRIAIYWGGVYMNLWIAFLLFSVGMVVADPFITFVCEYTAKTSLFLVVFNNIPIMRADGYLIIQDVVDLPGGADLLDTSTVYFYSRLRSWITRTPLDATSFGTPRQQHILMFFAVVRRLLRVMVLGFYVRTYLWATSEFGAWGVLATIVVLVLILGRPLLRSLRNLGRSLWTHRRAMVRPTRLLPCSALAALAVWGLFLARWPVWISGQATFRATTRAEVRPPIEGVVVAVSVRDGDKVRRGQELARLDTAPLLTRLREIEAEQAQRQSDLQLLQQGRRREEIALARAELKRAAVKSEALSTLDLRARDLASQGLLASSVADARASESALSRAAVDQGAAAVRLVEAKGRAEEVAAVQAQLKRLDAERSLLTERIDQAVLRSPVDGVVATARVDEKLGQHLDAGENFCTVVDPEHLYAETSIPVGEDLAALEPNSPAKLWLASGRTVTAQLATLPVRAQERDGGKETVTARTTPVVGGLPEGTTAEVRIYGKPRTLMARLARPVVQYLGLDFWALW